MPTFTTSKPEQSGARVILKPGKCNYEVIDATEKAKNGNDIIELKLRVTDADNKEATVFDNLIFTQKAEWKINQFLKSIGLHAGEGKTVEVTTDQVIGYTGTCIVKTGVWNDKSRNEIDSYTWEEEF